MKVFINSLGVALSALGAYLVWHYIAQLNFADRDAFLKGQGRLVVPTVTPEMINKFNFEKSMSDFGIGLILLGGVLQIASNYLAESC